MRLCRFLFNDTTEVHLGLYRDDAVISLDGALDSYCAATSQICPRPARIDLLACLPPDGALHSIVAAVAAWVEALAPDARAGLIIPIEQIQLLVPIARPAKILLLAGNYAAHVIERGGTVAERAETFPYVFMKPPSTTLTHPSDPIIIPAESPDHVDWEAELGVVIGRGGRNIAEADALKHVAGYTVVNDISDRKYTPNPGRKVRERDKFFDWLHGKWHDTFCPMGPCITSTDAIPDPQVLSVRLTVNGDLKQDGNTGQMIFPVAAVIAFISRWVTLEPGDVISTGTPSGVGSSTGTYLKPGDTVVATIEQIGSLSNPVEAPEAGDRSRNESSSGSIPRPVPDLGQK